MEVFNVISPNSVLSPYIKHYWTLEISGIQPISERIIPTGCASLVFHRGNSLFSITDRKMQPSSFVSGHTASYTDLSSLGKLNMIVVVFHPYGAWAFFKNPMNEFLNTCISTDDLNDTSYKELQDRVLNAPDNTSAIHFIEQFLIKRLSTLENDYNYKRMAAAIEALNYKTYSINSLAEMTCLSYKQFSRLFTQYIGTSPKEFSRVIRFQRALNLLETKKTSNLTQLSYESGFSDQSHLIKEFKAISGYTPKEFLSICNPYSDYFSES